MFRITILVDNNPHPELDLKTEHGLGIYFEADGMKWLLDVGASAAFAHNAAQLGIAVEDVDFVVISHGHADHTGGLGHFLKVNSKAKVILSEHIRSKKFYSSRHRAPKDISIDRSLFEAHPHRFIFTEGNSRLSRNVSLIGDISRRFEMPLANQTLYQLGENGKTPDLFEHEQVLAISGNEGVVVLSGCSHSGLLNILESCTAWLDEDPILACIGGTHLLDGDGDFQFETDEQILQIARTLKQQYPQMQLVTGHCTGTNAQQLIAHVFEGQFAPFYSGWGH